MQRPKEKEPLVGAKGHIRTQTYRTLNPQYDRLLTCDTLKYEASNPEPIKKSWKARVLGNTFPTVKDVGLTIMSGT